MIKYIDINTIRISNAFQRTHPSDIKVNECRDYWEKHHEQSKMIVLSKNNVLVDGYIQYLILKEKGVKIAEVEQPECQKEWTTYIYGMHQEGSGKEYVWKVPKSWAGWENDILPGDKILVETKYGIREIIVTKIEWLEEKPVNRKIRNVYKKGAYTDEYIDKFK